MTIPIVPSIQDLTLAFHPYSAVGNGATEPTAVPFTLYYGENISDLTRNHKKSAGLETLTPNLPAKKDLKSLWGWGIVRHYACIIRIQHLVDACV